MQEFPATSCLLKLSLVSCCCRNTCRQQLLAVLTPWAQRHQVRMLRMTLCPSPLRVTLTCSSRRRLAHHLLRQTLRLLDRPLHLLLPHLQQQVRQVVLMIFIHLSCAIVWTPQHCSLQVWQLSAWLCVCDFQCLSSVSCLGSCQTQLIQEAASRMFKFSHSGVPIQPSFSNAPTSDTMSALSCEHVAIKPTCQLCCRVRRGGHHCWDPWQPLPYAVDRLYSC